ncbi:ribulose-phosphate 3-epimerase [Coxiella endosymbiont of Amblyomma nuttalli]|uniref:ribulose-phosphate 3-epimerase n=1 Tax=Coxiella endosymbiont of Amblyomma nuttalli TaxID=2749996 RepID=UPI001BABACB4|nr:ribulose-phosphate 3-epimerase [Coxiella endosymbiont of Amblyomma nuttalli]QTS84215.1 Ribulose-phosphate 3-epimerase [Coxiella endosymbiont of Amblyomma nuttalli]
MVATQKFISASILSADFSRLGEEAKQIIDAGVDYIHFDVMDHHFVPNLSFGAVVCKALRHTKITVPIDVHLMVDNPDVYIKPFAEAGASLITFHPEIVKNVEGTIELIHQAGMRSGLAFNPDKSVSLLPPLILKQVNLVLLMSVNPGFSGQVFMPNSLERISFTRKLLDEVHSKAMLGIDGGIKADNIMEVSCAGANFFVVGSGLFYASNYKEEVKTLRQQLHFDN